MLTPQLNEVLTRTGPPTARDRKLIESGVAFPPRLERGTAQLADGSIIDALRTPRTLRTEPA